MPGENRAVVRYTVEPDYEAWVLPEGPVPESTGHSATIRVLQDVLENLVRERGLPFSVERNLALRWLERAPNTGIDPDLCLVTPGVARDVDLGSARLWEPGAPRPTLCIEVVSAGHSYKEYGVIQDRYAALAVPELWVVDPWLYGPRTKGGPAAVQLWLPQNEVFERHYFGPGPVYSPFLDVWVHVDTTEHWVALSRDASGGQPCSSRLGAAEDRARTAEAEAKALREQIERLKR